MRTRPDLQFPVGFMAARVSRFPNRVAQVARKILAYLKSTQEMKLVMGPNGSDPARSPALVGYSDASFSPFGENPLVPPSSPSTVPLLLGKHRSKVS